MGGQGGICGSGFLEDKGKACSTELAHFLRVLPLVLP